LLAQLDDMTASIGSYMPERDQPRFQKRVERLKGMLFWRLAEERASRLRDLEKQLAGNRALLAAVDQRIERLAAAEARFAAGVETDFSALSDRAGDVSRRVAMALGARREAIAQVLERGLHDEVAQTRQYLLTARIAIARATDQLAANTGGGGGDS
jgi:hypothetical protein